MSSPLVLAPTGHPPVPTNTVAMTADIDETNCVLQSGVELPYKAIKANIADTIDLLLHIERKDGRRIISQLLELTGYDMDRDSFQYRSIYEWKDLHSCPSMSGIEASVNG